MKKHNILLLNTMGIVTLVIILLIGYNNCSKSISFQSINNTVAKSQVLTLSKELQHTISPTDLEYRYINNIHQEIFDVNLVNPIKKNIAFENTDKPIQPYKKEVDLIISIDSSGSMSDEIGDVKTNLEDFINYLTNSPNIDIDLHLQFVRGLASNTPNITNYNSFHNASACFKFTKGQTSDLSAAINHLNDFQNESGNNQGESPVFWGKYLYENDKNKSTPCFRSNSFKFIIAVTDEDERDPGNYGQWANIGEASITTATQNSYVLTLNNLGVIVFGIVKFLQNANDNMNGKAVKNIVNQTSGKYYDIDTSFSTNLENISDFIKENVTSYQIASKQVESESLKVFVKKQDGSKKEYFLGSDFQMTSDLKKIDFTPEVAGNFTENDSLEASFLTTDKTTIDLTDAANLDIKIYDGNTSSLLNNTCIKKIPDSGSKYSLWDCIKNTYNRDKNSSLFVSYLPKQLKFILSPNAPYSKAKLEIALNQNVINPESYTLSKDSNNNIIFKLPYQNINYQENDSLTVSYYLQTFLTNNKLQFTLNDPHTLKKVTVNNQELNKACFALNQNIISISNCNDIFSNYENKKIIITYTSLSNINDSFKLPSTPISSQISATIINNENSEVEVNFILEEGDIIKFPDSQNLLNEKVFISYLEENFNIIPIDLKINDYDNAIKIELTRENQTRLLDPNEYTIKRSKPYSITLNNKEDFQMRDVLNIKYQGQ